MIINPNGDILGIGQDEDTIAFNIDLNEVDVQRKYSCIQKFKTKSI